MDSATESVIRRVVNVHRTLMDEFIDAPADPTTQPDDRCLLLPFSDVAQFSRAPQHVLMGFRLPRSQHRTHVPFYTNSNEGAGTIDEYHSPSYRDLVFVMAVVGDRKNEVWRMVDKLTAYYEQLGMVEVTWRPGQPDEVKLSFPRGMTREFEDRSVPNPANLTYWEGQARVRGVPIFDDYYVEGKLVKKFTVEIVDGDGPDPDDVAKINGDLLKTITVPPL